MEKVIQNLTNILLDEEKINLYVELYGICKEYIIYTRIKLLIDLVNFYLDLYIGDPNKTDFRGYAFTKETFNFDTNYKISYIENLYAREYLFMNI